MKIAIIIGAVILFSALCVVGLFLIRRTLYNMIDRRIERFQSELIEKQVREIQNMYKQVRGWRHDYRNHIQNMKIQLAQGNYAELDSYLDSLADDLNTVDTVIKTGNVMADAILNSKLSVAEKLNIRLNVKANIPNNIPLSDVELCALLGNLLDNAAEACAKLPESERFMRIYIGCLKNQLYMSVQNSAGDVKKVAVYCCLLRHCDESMTCYPSRSLIGTECCVDRKTVDLALKNLSAAGLVSCEHRHRQDGSATSNLYHVANLLEPNSV